MSDPRSNSLKFEAEFFRKSNNLMLTREKKIRSIQMRTIHVLLLLLVALLVGFGAYRSAVFLLESDLLRVRSFRLHGEPLYARDELQRILDRSAGNILALDLGRLREQLLLLPEVEDVAIGRVLPDTVEIHFKRRRPVFYFQADGTFQLLDAGGRVLGQQPEMPERLIPIRGSDRSVLGPIAALARELLPMRERIDHIAYREPYGIELKLRSGPEVFFPGTGGFMRKIDRYYRIKPRLPLDGSLVRAVDLRIEGRIYLECIDLAEGDS
jgi:cell division septal protein FtsQ